MLNPDRDGGMVTDDAVELIAERVIEALRCDLVAIAAELTKPAKANDQLSVEQVARRLGVGRSTVYAHWREWGGYKLGPGEKAPIRFDSGALPAAPPATPARPAAETKQPVSSPRARRGLRRDLLVDAPRFAHPLDEVA
jgi:transposase-like protein